MATSRATNRGVSGAAGASDENGNPVDTNTDEGSAATTEETPNVQPRLSERALGSMVTGVRLALPLMNAFARVKGQDEAIEQGDKTKLSDDERMVIGKTVSKLVYEGAAIIAAKHPVDAEMPLRDESGRYPALNVAHAVSAATAVYEVLDKRKVARAAEVEKQEKLKADKAKPDLQVLSAPTPPVSANQIRRAAMMNKRNQQTTNRGMAGGTYRVHTGASMMSSPSGCGCGQRYAAPMGPSSGGCGCGQSYAMQRVDEPQTATDSKDCDVDFFSISCETQKRLKACIKGAVCELLWSMDGVLCPDGKPADFKNIDTGALLTEAVGSFACSLVRCVPEALCPPRIDDCAPAPTDPLCNFAVEE